jgi:acetolactate synthase-1/2/3 large subunit
MVARKQRAVIAPTPGVVINRRTCKASDDYEAELCPGVEFGKVGEAFGAYAEMLTDPADVPDALKRCVEVVRGGRTALLHVRVTPI